MQRLIAFAPCGLYLALVLWAGLPVPHDGPSLPPAPWEQVR